MASYMYHMLVNACCGLGEAGRASGGVDQGSRERQSERLFGRPSERPRHCCVVRLSSVRASVVRSKPSKADSLVRVPALAHDAKAAPASQSVLY